MSFLSPGNRVPGVTLPPIADRPGKLPDGVSVRTWQRMASAGISQGTGGYGDPGLYDVTQIPWGTVIQTVYDGTMTDCDVGAANAAVATATTARNAANTALATAQADLTTARAAALAADETLAGLSSALDAAEQVALQAQNTVATLTRRGEDTTAAEAARDTAYSAYDTASTVYTTFHDGTWQAAQNAVNNGAVTSAFQAVEFAQEALAALTAAVPIVQANLDAYHAMQDAGGQVYVQQRFGGLGHDVAHTVTSAISWNATYSPDVSFPAGSCPFFVRYDTTYTVIQYRHELRLTDAAYRVLQNSTRWQLQLSWYEVTEVWPDLTVTWTPPPPPDPKSDCPSFTYTQPDTAADPTVNYAVKSEVFNASSAVQMPDGSWQLFSGTYTLDPGAGQPQTHTYIAGSIVLPSVTVHAGQARGGMRDLQGWHPFLAVEHPATGLRYHTLTASAGPDAPPGADYSGTLELALYDPAHATGIIYGDYDYISRPYIIKSTLSPACGDVTRLLPGTAAGYTPGYQPAPAADLGIVESATVLRIDDPPGLVVTLSNPQTTADLSAAVDALLSGNWENEIDEAACFQSGDGCRVRGRAVRFKLQYAPGDSRVNHATTWDVTYRYAKRTLNLDTGATTDTVVEVPGSYPGGPTTDAAWTDVDPPDGNAAIDIVPLPGTNDAPHTFGGGYVTVGLALKEV